MKTWIVGLLAALFFALPALADEEGTWTTSAAIAASTTECGGGDLTNPRSLTRGSVCFHMWGGPGACVGAGNPYSYCTGSGTANLVNSEKFYIPTGRTATVRFLPTIAGPGAGTAEIILRATVAGACSASTPLVNTWVPVVSALDGSAGNAAVYNIDSGCYFIENSVQAGASDTVIVSLEVK